jgi:hypothetical protein
LANKKSRNLLKASGFLVLYGFVPDYDFFEIIKETGIFDNPILEAKKFFGSNKKFDNDLFFLLGSFDLYKSKTFKEIRFLPG